MRKVGLYITTLLYDITQAGFEVSFYGDLTGMLRVDFFHEHDPEFYSHSHCGHPGSSREALEKDLIESLIRFKTKNQISDNPFNEPPPEAA